MPFCDLREVSVTFRALNLQKNVFSNLLSSCLGACLLLISATQVAHPTPDPHATIIAIGDLHADLKGAQETFHLAGVTDEQGRWVARGVTVVQTGDLTDRGPDGEPLLKWIRSLEPQATQHHSRFVVLLGNHEVMNLHGDWRYVSREDVESFGGVERRTRGFSLRSHGEWATWLKDKPSVIKLGDTLFVHGGVSQAFMRPADELSKQVTSAILSDPQHPILGELGPLWYRGYWLQPETLACSEAQRVLKALGARRMVMGHTTQRDGRIHSRCGGSLFAIDTGISKVYGGRPAALKIEGDQVTALYRSGSAQLAP